MTPSEQPQDVCIRCGMHRPLKQARGHLYCVDCFPKVVK